MRNVAASRQSAVEVWNWLQEMVSAQVVENKASQQPDIIPAKPDIILANGDKVLWQPDRIYSKGDRTASCRHKLRGLKDKPSP